MTRQQRSAEPSGLATLEKELARDLSLLNYPPDPWLPARADENGREMSDVVIVGGGLCGLTAAFALLREGVTRLRILDASPAGAEGPWVTYARMNTLRSPKHLTGPALGLPRLTFRAWYEAQWGEHAWEVLDRIPRTQWMDYLRWYRAVLDLPVENETRVTRIEPEEHGFALSVRAGGTDQRVRSRKVVLATGREGIARARIPEAFAPFMGGPCYHSADPLDFRSLAGRRVVVIGLGASAMDNAACALEAGARSVTVLARAEAMPRINKAKGIVYAGFTHGFPHLPEADRLALLSYIVACRVAPPRSALLRVAGREEFTLSLDTQLRGLSRDGQGLRLETSRGALDADAVILGTGFRIDLDGACELTGVAPHIMRWRDLPAMADVPADEEYLDFPYLGPSLQFMPRVAGSADWLANLYCFNLAAQLSHGNVSSDIPAVSEGATRLARGICRDFFLADRAHHAATLHAYDDAELDGDELPLDAWWPPL